jgi:carboxymethylenebutenolidase
MAVLPLLEVNYANAQVVQENYEDIIIEEITYTGGEGTMKGYLARPKKDALYGGVIVIHENRGLNPHIKDVTRRVAKAGFIGMAPDALSPFGGTPANEDEARELIGKLDAAKNTDNFLKGLEYLRSRKECNGKTGCVGFCWGGGMANQLAVHDPALNAAVAFYGRQPSKEDVSKIKARVQLHYGALDERINEGIPAYEEALKAAGVQYELFMYEGAQHAFHNDTAPTRYNEAAAKLAWKRTIELFGKTIQ